MHQFGQTVTIKEIVSKNERRGVAIHELCTDEIGLGETFGPGLLRVRQTNSPLLSCA